MPKGDHGGSASGGGHDFQSDVFAYIACHAISAQPLSWFEDMNDVPMAIAMETGGAGDDLQVELQGSKRIEIQVKHGLQRGADLWDALFRLIEGIESNKELVGALIVDSSASGTVREHLRLDVRRIANDRTDDLSQIGQELLNRLTAHKTENLKLLRRLQLVVLDLQEGSTGATAGMALLRNVLKSPLDTRTAWDILAKTGSRTTRDRCRRDCRGLLGLLRPHVALSETSALTAVTLQRYLEWVTRRESAFNVPMLCVALPISAAWDKLRVMQEHDTSGLSARDTLAQQIAAYHEWEKLADRRGQVETLRAEEFVLRAEHGVIVGGPGAGKSTLLSKLAHGMSTKGHVVLHVSLKQVCQLTSKGSTFEEAIIISGCVGLGIDADSANKVLSNPEILLADGLDECDPDRLAMAQKLTTWSYGHPHCRIYATTRPVGHAPDLLPGFKHAELLPLDTDGIAQLSDALFHGIVQNDDQRATLVKEFQARLQDAEKSGGAARLAARNPLLLCFLVALFRDDRDFGPNRATLFENIVGMFKRAPINGKKANYDVEDGIANAVLDLMGWHLLNEPTAEVCILMQSIADKLRISLQLNPIVAECKAEHAIAYWEERRILERLSSGLHEVLTFIHQLLGEYAAGRYLAKMPSEEIEVWIQANARSPKWRQPIQLACSVGANSVLESLLLFDNPDDPCSSEAVLGAYGLAEANAPSQNSVQAVAARIQQRLLSPIPIIAIEAAAGLMSLARIAPEIVKTFVLGLVEHEQSWTRLAGIALSLESCPKDVRMEVVVNWVNSFEPVKLTPFSAPKDNEHLGYLPQEAYDLQKCTLVNAIEKICCELKREDAWSLIEPFICRGDVSWGMIQEVTELASRNGFQREVEMVVKKRYAGFNYEKLLRRDKTGENLAAIAFLASALRVSRDNSTTDGLVVPKAPFSQLSKLFAVMGFWEATFPQWLVLGRNIAIDEIGEVMKGCMAVVDVDPVELYREAKTILKRLLEEEVSFVSILDHSHVFEDWSKASTVEYDKGKLVRALCYPSHAVVITGARLVEHGNLGSGIGEELRGIIGVKNPHTLFVLSELAPCVWGAEAFDILLTRLDGELCRGCEFIFKRVCTLAPIERRSDVISRLLRGLMVRNPIVATGAAETLRDCKWIFRKEDIKKFHSALEFWTKEGAICSQCNQPVRGESCESCHIVPESPRSPLIELLAQENAFSSDMLSVLTTDKRSDVARVSGKALAQQALENEKCLCEILAKIENGGLPLSVLNAILSQPPEKLANNRKYLCALFAATNGDVRAQVVGSLTLGWLPDKDTNDLLGSALTDKDPQVRNRATVVARAISNGKQDKRT